MLIVVDMSTREDVVQVRAGEVELEGNLVVPADATGLVVFAHGSGSSRHSPLARVRAPTLLVVGALDTPVIEMNRSAMEEMEAEVELEIVPGATHLFEEPGKLGAVMGLARDWFGEHLAP